PESRDCFIGACCLQQLNGLVRVATLEFNGGSDNRQKDRLRLSRFGGLPGHLVGERLRLAGFATQPQRQGPARGGRGSFKSVRSLATAPRDGQSLGRLRFS